MVRIKNIIYLTNKLTYLLFLVSNSTNHILTMAPEVAPNNIAGKYKKFIYIYIYIYILIKFYWE